MKIFAIGDAIMHTQYGEGKVVAVNEYSYLVSFKNRGTVEISHKFEGITAIEEVSGGMYAEVKKAMREVLSEYSDIQQTVHMGPKWLGGKLIIQPSSDSLKPKEIPIEAFFHKIVMVRDRLRVLEQNINSHAKLDDQDKVHLQQYITRIYGSLTTFNVLFRDQKDNFVGDKSGGDEK